jgi:hypothetical protein
MVTLSVLLFPKLSSATLQSVDGRISEVDTKKNKKSDSEVLISIESLDIAAAFIKDHCTQILSAVKNSGRCLYRGESSCGISPVLLSPDFDNTIVTTNNTIELLLLSVSIRKKVLLSLSSVLLSLQLGSILPSLFTSA